MISLLLLAHQRHEHDGYSSLSIVGFDLNSQLVTGYSQLSLYLKYFPEMESINCIRNRER